jgi:hypothetical protein
VESKDAYPGRSPNCAAASPSSCVLGFRSGSCTRPRGLDRAKPTCCSSALTNRPFNVSVLGWIAADLRRLESITRAARAHTWVAGFEMECPILIVDFSIVTADRHARHASRARSPCHPRRACEGGDTGCSVRRVSPDIQP